MAEPTPQRDEQPTNESSFPPGNVPAGPTPPSPDAGPTPGWIEGLAKRSTGLPGDVTTKRGATQGERTLWTFAGLGLQFAATTALFTYMGYALDRRMGWSPWGMISLAMIAVIGSLYLLIKEAMRDNTRK
jgi:F0F1-type ATP synthase assembly protein I